MNYKIEKEYKILIDKKSFDRIVEQEDLELVIQENFYYDLKQNHAACRIRMIDDLYIFTLKMKQNNQVLEYEYRIEDDNINHPSIKQLLTKLNITSQPEYLGSMLTCRYFKKLKHGELVIDLNKYLGTQDYEIEYELYQAEDSHTEEFESFLAKYSIEWIENEQSKYQRFYQRLKVTQS